MSDEFHTGPPPIGAATVALVAGLRGSPTHRLSVEVFQRHDDAGTGRCARCGDGVAPCLARRRAAAVIQAAGEDPRRYARSTLVPLAATGRASVPPPASTAPASTAPTSVEPAEVTGYALGRLGRRANIPAFPYER